MRDRSLGRRTRCTDGRLMRHDPQPDDPGLETDIGKCPDCGGNGCETEDGRVPDRESFWLVERKVSPPQYVGAIAQWTTDPWVARRFETEREAHDHWRLMSIFRDESQVIEHLFLNRYS